MLISNMIDKLAIDVFFDTANIVLILSNHSIGIKFLHSLCQAVVHNPWLLTLTWDSQIGIFH